MAKLAAGIAGAALPTSSSPTEVPWRGAGAPRDPRSFFPAVAIDGDRWDKLYPYRLLVVDASTRRVVARGGGTTQVRVLSGTKRKDDGKVLTTISFEPIGKTWQFDLPITPEALNITDGYAGQVSATLRGVLEEHSGLRFKTITLEGTMGVWPFRPNLTPEPGAPSVLQSLFGSTLDRASNLVSQVQRTIRAATSNHPAQKPITNLPGVNGAPPKESTGWYQSQMLQQFLEQYAEAKTRPENAGWRLVLDIPKQNQSFVVHPVSYNWSQSKERPLEVRYRLQLKAWRRIDLAKPGERGVAPAATPLEPNILQRINRSLEQARRTAGAAISLIKAVRADFQGPLNTLRQVALFAKDLSGVATAVVDLPRQIVGDYRSAIKEGFSALPPDTVQSTSSAATRSSLASLASSSASREGLSEAQVTSGALGPSRSQLQSLDPVDSLFSNPEENFDLFNLVQASQLRLTPEQQDRIDEAVEDARSLTVEEIRLARSEIMTLAGDIANRFGAGNQEFSDTYGRPAPTERAQPMTPEEFAVLADLYEAAAAMDLLASSYQLDDDRAASAMEYADGLAEDGGVPFSVPQSKVLVPVPLGATMEKIALRYLGNPQRWAEIAVLNGLSEPYIDEEGFSLPLLSNGDGRQVVVADAMTVTAGQRVAIRSSAQPETVRRVLEMKRVNEGSVLITLDGLANLSAYTLSDGAYVQAYLPGTVNSQSRIWVPSDLSPASDEPRVREVPASREDPLAGLSGVDWMLDEYGDLARTGQGDIRLTWGMQNLVQGLKIMLLTRRGTLITHPDFGLSIGAGESSADFDAAETYRALDELVSSDPRFDGLSSLRVDLDGPELRVSMSVLLSNGSGVFPLGFVLPAA
ncbi:MAG: hypothetical protein IT285_16230 [Bdellovibrionales bacterium]|nr:hypothetical protein [Bdellovibrionales bacterium]